MSKSLTTRGPAVFTAALLKVASRCNLNCDYCYVYNHLDQSWRHQPKLMSESVVGAFARRVESYIDEAGLDRFSVVFHGGEPLLYSAEGLAHIASILRGCISPSCRLDFSMQTNGLLLTDKALEVLADAGISISLSLDGPKYVNDLHRLGHRGQSSFVPVMAALRLLSSAPPGVFSGVIAVIDPAVSPRDLFEFFAPMGLPRLDLLLPDATHLSRSTASGQAEDRIFLWLKEALELWYREYSALPVRWFDAVLGSRVGIPSPTDAMGLGRVSLLVIETDGSYTDHDVFKITPTGAQLSATVFDTDIASIALHPRILEHGFRLTFDGLASECRACPAVESCGGGAVMHRAHPDRGLEAPTVYCREMFTLFSTATTLLRESLQRAAAAQESGDDYFPAGASLVKRCTEWRSDTEARAARESCASGVIRGTSSAAAVFLSLVSPALKSTTAVRDATPLMYWLERIRVHAADRRLVEPFLDSIEVLPPESVEVEHAMASLAAVEGCLRTFDPFLPEAMSRLISDILFVKSTVPNEQGIFSFSDDHAPNVIYVAPYAGGLPVPAEDLADSIYHEFLHNVLYHIERSGSFLFDRVHPHFPAPWRPGLRPSGGFLHGTYVFTGLALYWRALAANPPTGIDRVKAHENSTRSFGQAVYGILSLREFALLTRRGMQLVETLTSLLGGPFESMGPPGALRPRTEP